MKTTAILFLAYLAYAFSAQCRKTRARKKRLVLNR